MKILVLNGSPRKNGNTTAMVQAFAEGAQKSGHQVINLQVGSMNISGCLGCESCHSSKNKICVINDEQRLVYEAMEQVEMLVLASPIYYFMMSAQLETAIQRMHSGGIPSSIKQTALFLSSGASGVYDAAIRQYKMIFADYLRLPDMGIYTAGGIQNKSDEMRNKLYEFGLRIAFSIDEKGC